MDAWAIRRVRKLLENETDERVLEILRGSRDGKDAKALLDLFR
jgi:hypothetical protein